MKGKKKIIIRQIQILTRSKYTFAMINMRDIVFQLKKTIDEKVPALSHTLQEGASHEEIEELENVTGVNLPETFKTFYLTCNGQKNGDTGLTEMGEILSISAILSKWNGWKSLHIKNNLTDFKSDPDKGIRDNWFNLKWIPFTYNGSSDHFCIDMDPDNGGNIGQVITIWHDSPERELVAVSFEDWIKNYIADLKAGKFKYDPELGNLEKLYD